MLDEYFVRSCAGPFQFGYGTMEHNEETGWLGHTAIESTIAADNSLWFWTCDPLVKMRVFAQW